MVKNLSASAGELTDVGSIPGSGRPPGGGHGKPLQCSCLENPMDRGGWQATVHRFTKNQTQLKQQPACIHLELKTTRILFLLFLGNNILILLHI